VVNIPGYSVSGEIGRGGMAVVYRARQVLLDREVALKVLNPSLAQDPVYAQRFLQEARMLAALGHPHIVPVYDVGVTPEGLHYFSMQLFNGGDFGRKLREGIDEVELVRVLLAVAQALGFAHTRGYVHRDVTPANILFDDRDRPVLTDFGIARALAATSRITASGLSVGTSHYMSPEQARGQEVDRRSDIYSIGVLLFEALAGNPPFDGDDGFAVAYAHVHEPVPRLPEGLERWQPLIDRAMAKNPDERFGDCAAFIDGLRETAPTEFATVLKKEGVSAIAPLASATPNARAAKTPPAKPAAKPTAKPAAVEPIAEKPGAAAPPAARSPLLLPQKPSRMPLFLAIGLIVAGIGMGAVYWFTRGPATPAPRTATVAPTTPPAASTSPATPPAQVPVVAAPDSMPLAASETESDPGAGTEGDAADVGTEEAIEPGELPTVEDPVVRLLAMGRANLAAQRLTSPPGGNALDRYKLVFLWEPRNRDALAGIASVAQAYVDLAAKQDRETALPQWLDYLARAEAIAREYEAAEPLRAATALRQSYVDELLARGAEAIGNWRRDDAIAVHRRALQVLPASDAAQKGLRLAEQVGQAGYVFRDGKAESQAPEMVVAANLGVSRNEITVAQFRAYWRDAGQARFGADTPACRDRESFFRSSRKRTWQDPGFEQSDRHPVVCASFAMAEDYAAWLSRRSGKRYRLPTATEWRAVGSTGIASDCSANVRDEAFRGAFGGREGAACSDGFATTAPVGRFAARRPGLYDVDGNVREWVTDCDAGNCKERLALGASWLSQSGDPAAPAYAADAGFNTVGFRVVRELDAASATTRSE
jgi:serine/threonine-protein kinase PpkA